MFLFAMVFLGVGFCFGAIFEEKEKQKAYVLIMVITAIWGAIYGMWAVAALFEMLVGFKIAIYVKSVDEVKKSEVSSYEERLKKRIEEDSLYFDELIKKGNSRRVKLTSDSDFSDKKSKEKMEINNTELRLVVSNGEQSKVLNKDINYELLMMRLDESYEKHMKNIGW